MMKTKKIPDTTDWRIYECMVPPERANWRPGDEPTIKNHIILTDSRGTRRIIPVPDGVRIEVHTVQPF